MKKLFLLLAILLSSLTLAQAQDLPTPTPVDVGSIISNISFDSGVGYDTKNKQWTSVNTIKAVEYNKTDNTGKYSSFLNYIGAVDPAISVGYSTTDKAVVGFSFTLVNPKMLGLNSPLLNYISIRPFAMYSFYHLTSADAGNIKNSWIFGAYLMQVKI